MQGQNPGGEDWPNLAVDDDSLRRWAGLNTGLRTKWTPALDADIMDPEAAAAVGATAIEWFEGRGKIPIRFGQSPKRALFFRTAAPFKKMAQYFRAPSGKTHKIEILGDGQQIIVAGIHPDTKEPYTFHGDPIWNVEREDLVEVTEHEMRQLLTYLTEMLVSEFQFVATQANGQDRDHGDNSTVARHHPRDPVDDDEMLAGARPGDVDERVLRASASRLRRGLSSTRRCVPSWTTSRWPLPTTRDETGTIWSGE